MDKMKMETANKTLENLAKLKEMFPEVITESKDENGEIVSAVDAKKLEQLLSTKVIEGDESYDFTWVGKKQAMVEACKPIRKTLRPCREESVNWENTQNLYIEGDNLDILKLLQESYLNKVKMIYIDPPYNTGNDSFIYPDDYSTNKELYDEEVGAIDESGYRMFKNTEANGRFHSSWCSMMYSRLKLARNLLSEDGAIFISIDDNEADNMQKLCNEIFGETNFVAQIPWRKRTSKSDVPFGVSQDYEWIMCYAKSSNLCSGIKFERKYFTSPDYPNDRWRLSDLTTQKIESQRPNSAFDLVDPKTHKIYKYNPKRLWGITKDTFQEYYDKGKIVFPDDYDFLNITIPAYRVFESEDKQKALAKYGTEFARKAMSTVLPSDIGMSEDGNKECAVLLGNNIFSFPKPSKLIKYFLNSTTQDDDIILDFFSGSATTAHAVMQLNAEDDGKRKFIMVQLPEICDEKSEAYQAKYKNICEIGKERIRRAGKKIVEESGKKDLDIGFRVLKLDESNMKDVYFTPEEYKQTDLVDMVSNIKEDRTPEDLLYACMLEWGLELSLPHKVENIAGYNVHIVNDGDLIACFDNRISEEAIKQIADKKPLRAVFRDSSFASDAARVNVGEIFKLKSPNTTIKVI